MSSKLNWNYTMEVNKPLKEGTLLLAEPFLTEEYFARTAILLCNHEAEEGSFGFIINKPLEEPLSYFTDDIDLPDAEVFHGGPVGEQSLHFLHRNDPEIEDALHLFGGWYWGGNVFQIKEEINAGRLTADNLRLFLGYSGWSEGQLRNEILNNSWVVSKMRPEYLEMDADNLWETALRDMGGVYKSLANYPSNPSSN